MDDGRARLVVLALGDPHLLEGAQGRKNRATDPHRVLALRWCHNLNLHGRRCQCRELLCHALADASKHYGATRKYKVAVETIVNVTLQDGLEAGTVDATGLLTNETWLEKHLGATETFATNGDDTISFLMLELSVAAFITVSKFRAM